MNLNDKNIDQLFRDAAQNSDAPRYDHSYWNEVNSMLNKEDKRKRGFLLWSIGGSVIVALLVSTLFIVNNNQNSDVQLAGDSNSNTKSFNSEHSNSNSEHNQAVQAGKSQIAIDKINTTNKNITEGNTTSLAETNARIDSGNNAPSISRANNGLIDKDPIKTESTKQLPLDDRVEHKKDIKDNQASTSNKNENTTEAGLDKNYIIESLSPKVVYLSNPEVSKELLPFKLQNDKILNVYAKLSAGLMENYETSRPFQSGLFDLSLNLEFQKDQVLLRTGLGLQATSGADLVVSQRAKVFGFGLTTYQNNLSYQSLYDLYIPIEIGYSLNNTSFGFGSQINYLLNTTMNYESLENNNVVEKDKLKGFKEGLNSFTAQGYVWLEQKISNRFVAGVKIGTSLNSRINEGRYFNESATTNPLYGQLTLRYNLIK
tara:strand:+ start:388 stop:1674 length:1287 start_codon:yes stop_codon:yes gene_type:complete